jgi:hypothetical protein
MNRAPEVIRDLATVKATRSRTFNLRHVRLGTTELLEIGEFNVDSGKTFSLRFARHVLPAIRDAIDAFIAEGSK